MFSAWRRAVIESPKSLEQVRHLNFQALGQLLNAEQS
jgi:hypothetical protein